jgi:hypothetical protein
MRDLLPGVARDAFDNLIRSQTNQVPYKARVATAQGIAQRAGKSGDLDSVIIYIRNVKGKLAGVWEAVNPVRGAVEFS